ncbi:MAG TPA: hypothetical protein VF255_10895, partial [Solirubrobacterales bacterium]
MTKVPGGHRPRLHIVSSGKVIGGALVGGLGLLIPIYGTANPDLTGLRFVAAIALAAGAILLLVEGVQRIRSGERRRGPWLCGIGVVLALASALLGLIPADAGGADDDTAGGGLRLDLRPTAPDLFHLAFEREIPLPRSGEGWAELRRRGGIDIGDSRFRLILANEGPRPISVLSVKAEVLGSEPMPRGTETHVYTQGDEGIDSFLALLPDGEEGSSAPVYASGDRVLSREELETKTPFFESSYVLLRPGEVYPADLTIQADTPRTIEYRLVAEGESADERFVVRSRPYRLVGDFEDPYQKRFARYYTFGYDPSTCTDAPENDWIDSRTRRRSLACPYGPGHPYAEQPPSEAEYPPGDLQVSLQLGRGRQSATISGVEVGAAPAAVPVPGVVEPLLRSLGTWTSCSVFSPSTDYWTARWEAWGLDLTFESDGGTTDCTPRSPAALREINLREEPGRVDTEKGPVLLGSVAPAPVRRLAEPSEESEYE